MSGCEGQNVGKFCLFALQGMLHIKVLYLWSTLIIIKKKRWRHVISEQFVQRATKQQLHNLTGCGFELQCVDLTLDWYRGLWTGVCRGSWLKD